MPDPNFGIKHNPVVSVDCMVEDHKSCAGEESALWPDGEITIRQCSCPCHTAALRQHTALPFSAAGRDVKQGKFNTIARAVSRNMATRIANALNAYTPDKRGQ